MINSRSTASQVEYPHLQPWGISLVLHIVALASMALGVIIDTEHPYRSGLATTASVMGVIFVIMLWMSNSDRERDEVSKTYIWFVLEFSARTILTLVIGVVIVWICVGAFNEKDPLRAELYGITITVVLWLLFTRDLYNTLDKEIDAS